MNLRQIPLLKTFTTKNWHPIFGFLFVSFCFLPLHTLLIETAFFRQIYSADSLYLPLLAKDWWQTGIPNHWYLPPSPYFFPDVFFIVLGFPFFPFLYLPSVYAVFQISWLTFVMFIWVLQKKNKKFALRFLSLFHMFWLSLSGLSLFLSDSPNPFSLIYLGGFHSTGFLLGFWSVFFLQGKPIGKLSQFALGLFGVLLYISDRYASVLVLTYFLIQKKREGLSLKNFLILALGIFVVCSLGEIALYFLGKSFHIPKSWDLVWNTLTKKDVGENLFVSLHYLWDFSKHLFYQGKTSLLLFILALGLRFRFSKNPFIPSTAFIGCIIALLLFIGRFTYLNPYPIRYLFPLLYLFVLSLSFAILTSPAQKYFRRIGYALLGFGFFLSFTLPLSWERPRERERVLNRQEEKELPYEFEKPVRFWTEGEKTPTPMDSSGKPYPWITGAFRKPPFHTP